MPLAPPSHTRATQLSAPHHFISTVAKSKGYLPMPICETLPTHSTHTARCKEADSCFRARGANIFLPRQEVVNIGRLARSLCLWCHTPPGPCGGDTTTQGGRSGVVHKLRYGAFGAWGKRKWRSQVWRSYDDWMPCRCDIKACASYVMRCASVCCGGARSVRDPKEYTGLSV